MTTRSRTNELRKTVRSALLPVKLAFSLDEIYFDRAKPEAMYPHIVCTLPNLDNGDLSRHDYMLTIDIWARGDAEEIETAYDIADAVEDVFNNLNDPQSTILPTFFIENRIEPDDPDKSIKRIRERVVVQLYEEVSDAL